MNTNGRRIEKVGIIRGLAYFLCNPSPKTSVSQIVPGNTMETAMKTCEECRTEKSQQHFAWQNKSHTILRSTCKECDSQSETLFGINNEYEARRAARLFIRYELTPASEEQFIRDQNGLCASCGELPDGKRLSTSHFPL